MKGSRGGHGIASSIVIINHESPSLVALPSFAFEVAFICLDLVWMMVVGLMVGMVVPMVVVMVRRLMLVMIMVVSPLQFGLKRRCPALRRRPLTRPLWPSL